MLNPTTDLRALVAIDLGAESCRVSLMRWTGLGPRIELVHRFPNGASETADGLHWNLERIMVGLDLGLRKAAQIATEGIRSIAIDGWGVDYVRLGADGKPVAEPFCYRDERTVVAEHTLNARLSPERMREITGIGILRINTAYQLFADSAELRALPWLNLPEYILYALGGRPVSERTLASHTQMLSMPTPTSHGEWSEEIVRELDVPASAMPELVDPGTDVGQLTGPLAELPAFANTRLIAPCTHDTASAIAAIPDAADDWAYISSGTWSLVGALLLEPNNAARAREENFTNLIGADNTICFHKNVNGMWLLRQCMETWAAEGATIEIGALVEAAAQASVPAYVLDVDDPDLLLSGRMPQRINAQLHRRNLPELSTHPDDAPAMAAFLFQSLAARYGVVLRSVQEITGKTFRKLYIMGGGSQNQLLNRLTAEATGLEVIRAGTECSTLGNFAVQLSTLEPKAATETRPSARWAATLRDMGAIS
ncbi:rhamnulokinase [Bryocella elongata]|uniref:Rhamnulokinase n=1 Tax=Bryocella elongata TaxID=863522 RepID=A0A1H5UAA1_9BACT|nr:FGGY-family carbohydrate kinase [Bryocella elongata]SEF71976.1 rhamnulokinase [Bryocella elongata]